MFFLAIYYLHPRSPYLYSICIDISTYISMFLLCSATSRPRGFLQFTKVRK